MVFVVDNYYEVWVFWDFFLVLWRCYFLLKIVCCSLELFFLNLLKSENCLLLLLICCFYLGIVFVDFVDVIMLMVYFLNNYRWDWFFWLILIWWMFVVLWKWFCRNLNLVCEVSVNVDFWKCYLGGFGYYFDNYGLYLNLL